MTIWHVDVDRVRLMGARLEGLGGAELQRLIEHAVRDALATSPLPPGRAMAATVDVHVPTLRGGAAVAGAIGSGVSRAAGGRAHG